MKTGWHIAFLGLLFHSETASMVANGANEFLNIVYVFKYTVLVKRKTNATQKSKQIFN